MADKSQQQTERNPVKDPQEWTTGAEPMTGPQRSYLGTLAREADEPVEEDLTKAEASERIDELQEKTGRRGSSTRKTSPKRSARTGRKRRQ